MGSQHQSWDLNPGSAAAQSILLTIMLVASKSWSIMMHLQKWSHVEMAEASPRGHVIQHCKVIQH